MQSAQRTVLVVDDEDVIRETVREILTDEGYRVIAPLDGSEVMDLVLKEAPDVILLDVWMPEMDGIVLLRRIRREHPEARVIMISGHGSIHTAVTATKLGAFDFIEKPLSLDGLLATIERACGDARREVSAGEERLHAPGGGVGQPFVQSGFHGNGDSGVPQKTLRKSVVACGLGLHSGVSTGVILHPLPEDSGIHFGGISADATVPAHLDYVRSTDFATSLQRDGVVVGTVEHLLAALHSYGITNLLIKMYGEIPIMDGSAIEFCRLIEEAGVEEQQESARRSSSTGPFASAGTGRRRSSSNRRTDSPFTTGCSIRAPWERRSSPMSTRARIRSVTRSPRRGPSVSCVISRDWSGWG